ncbi:MAG: hypothetical protein ACFFBI_13880, partial [Promethearchaeota archaeon]
MKIKEMILKYKVELIVFSLFLIYLICIRIVIPIAIPLPPGTTWFDWDFYIHMAKDPLAIFKHEVIPPFCYRPLVSLLAWAIPLDLQLSFALINFVAIYLTGIVLYFTLRLHFNKVISVVGLVFFCLLNYMIPGIPSFKNYYFFNVYFYLNYMVDPLAYFFLMCCFYSILKSNNKLYCIFLTLGVLTKEVVLFTIPVYLIYLYMKQEKGVIFKKKVLEVLKCSIYLLPSVGIFILIHLIVVPDSINPIDYPYWFNLYQGNKYFSLQMILIFIKLRLDELSLGYGFLQYTIGIWGIHTFILFFFNKKKVFFNWVKLYLIFMILVYLQLL